MTAGYGSDRGDSRLVAAAFATFAAWAVILGVLLAAGQIDAHALFD
jgi:hypothetical protein